MADTPEHQQSNAEKKTETKADTASALPVVESPSISPAVTEPATPAVEPQPAPAVADAAAPAEAAPAEATPIVLPFVQRLQQSVAPLMQIKLRPRQKRTALLAASVALAAGFGAIIGAAASGSFASTPKQAVVQVVQPAHVAQTDESKALQQTVAKLSREIAALKANVDTAAKSANAQIAKISDKLARDSAEITGSISAPQTVAVPPAPVPLPKPAQRVAAVEAPPAPPPVLDGWRIVDVYDGYVYVQGHGRMFEVAIGTQLPGLGRVEQVKRQDGRWTVVTPKGVIASMSDRTVRERRYID